MPALKSQWKTTVPLEVEMSQLCRPAGPGDAGRCRGVASVRAGTHAGRLCGADDEASERGVPRCGDAARRGDGGRGDGDGDGLCSYRAEIACSACVSALTVASAC